MNLVVNQTNTFKITMEHSYSTRMLRWTTYLLFFVFAMATDAVGVIIPEIQNSFNLNATEAGLFHYIPMFFIATGGLFLGFISNRIGHKRSILIGLALFSINSILFVLGNSFGYFLILLAANGIAISIFKTASLSLVGELSKSSQEHTTTMNYIEGFFAIGAIIGPFLVSYLIADKIEWKWMYAFIAILSLMLFSITSYSNYPITSNFVQQEKVSITSSMLLLKNPLTLGFALAIFLYVSVECAIYVWMPSLIKGYNGNLIFVSTYALSIFFILRALGRFIGAFILKKVDWKTVILLFTLAVAMCFVASSALPTDFSIMLLPTSGLFMAAIYPTLNSKGISCFPKHLHGTISGIFLFFTALGAAVGPFLMGLLSDINSGNIKYGFILACFFSIILAILALLNILLNPTRNILK